MGKFTVGAIVLVTFPFSDLPARQMLLHQATAGGKGQKVRPALVAANVEFNNLILCQITSKPYTSKISICLKQSDFATVGLPIISYVRPDKLFTADTTIIKKTVGQLTAATRSTVFKNIRALFI